MLRDPVENTKEYIDAMEIINKEIDALPDWVSPDGRIAYKKKRLEEMGIKWKTPREMNPDIIFD